MSLQEFYRGNPSLYISTDDRTDDGVKCYKNQTVLSTTLKMM